MFEMEQWAQTRLFSSCKFHTPFYGRAVTGLALFSEAGEPDHTGRLILTYGKELARCPEGTASALDRLEKSGAAGLIICCDSPDGILVEELARECESRSLILAELPFPSSFTDFIRMFYSCMPCAATGEICDYGEIFQRLQSAFFSHGLDQLLRELYRWTGRQTALVVGQDTYVHPRTPILDPVIFYPVYWQKESALSPFVYVRRYNATQPPTYILQADLYKNSLPFGMLFLIGNGEKFKETDYYLLNYASILCTGLSDLNLRSRQIQALFAKIRRENTLTGAELELLPEEGYALALQEFHNALPGTAVTGAEDYLSYLLHYHFPRNLCYSFQNNELLIFASTEDVENFCRKLTSLLNTTGRQYHVGISRKYDRAQVVTAFSEAIHAVKMAGLLDYGQNPCFFHQLGIYRLFTYPENPWAVNQMLGEMDVMLNDLDNEKKDILTLTVRTFVKNNFSYQKTADELFTHVNTVRYRIHQLEELWNADLSSTEGRLLFSVLAKLLPLWMQEFYNRQPGEDEGR
ncbi:MAG: helix-turn-helix domain-containing protein [Enterocloster asparagiformis]|nr:helix-turn-helix domain-containing protein [Enterocloster asparagiformis]